MLPGASVADFVPDGTDQVLVLDQFEELAARDPQQARAQLAAIVALTRTNPVRAVLTLRGAALDDLLTPELAKVLNAATLHVAPLDRANLRETIVKPAERAPGLDFEPGLVDRILDDAGSEPGQLPLVESLLADLWRRREGGRLTWRGYTEAGGVVGSVAQHAERVVSELAGAAPDPQFHDRLRRLFAQLAAPDRTGRFVRVPVRTAALPPEQRAMVPQLAAGRLLVVGRDAFDVEVVELAHQALIEHWPRLRDWLEQDRAFLAWRAQTDEQRERWESAGRDDGALLRGSALVAAGEWVPARDAEVAPETREFVARSATYQRRTARRLRAATAIFAVLALAAGLLAVVAVQRGDRLADELMAANADRLGREATARSLTDPLAATQLAITAWRSDPSNPAARTALLGSAVAFQDVDLVLPDLRGNLGFLGFNSEDDVTIAVSLTPSHTVLLGASGSSPQRWPLPVDGDNATFAYGGSWIATVAANGAVVIWDVATRAVRRTVPMDGKVLTIAQRPDGRATVVVDRGPAGIVLGTLGVESPSWSERPLPGVATDLASVEVTPDGTKVFEGFLRPQGESWSVRTLAANPADDRETPLPAGTTVVGDGLGRLECVPPPDTHSQAAVRIVPVEGDVPARTIGLTTVTCYDTRLSADHHWLVEYANAGWEAAERTMVRLTSVVDGAQFQVLLPPSRVAPLPTKQRNALKPDLSITVARAADGRVTVYAVLADSVDPKARNSTMVRARAVPIQPGTQNRQVTQDGRYVVTVEPGIGPTVTDRFTNQVVATASMDLRPNNSSIDVDNDMWVTVREQDGWTLRRYALPSLSLLGTYPLPGDPRAPAASFVGGPGDGLQPGDPVVVLAGGVLPVARRADRRTAGNGGAAPIQRRARRRAEVLHHHRPPRAPRSGDRQRRDGVRALGRRRRPQARDGAGREHVAGCGHQGREPCRDPDARRHRRGVRPGDVPTVAARDPGVRDRRARRIRPGRVPRGDRCRRGGQLLRVRRRGERTDGRIRGARNPGEHRDDRTRSVGARHRRPARTGRRTGPDPGERLAGPPLRPDGPPLHRCRAGAPARGHRHLAPMPHLT
jgi:hypothetical protein